MQENRGSADITPIQDSTHTVRLRLRCAFRLQPGPARTFTVRTLTSVDHYAEGMGNLRGRRSGGMQARTTHNQTTERNSMVTQASPRLTRPLRNSRSPAHFPRVETAGDKAQFILFIGFIGPA